MSCIFAISTSAILLHSITQRRLHRIPLSMEKTKALQRKPSGRREQRLTRRRRIMATITARRTGKISKVRVVRTTSATTILAKAAGARERLVHRPTMRTSRAPTVTTRTSREREGSKTSVLSSRREKVARLPRLRTVRLLLSRKTRQQEQQQEQPRKRIIISL